MPDRIVRADILTSDPVNRLGWSAEVFYRRLFNIVDDYGRYDGRPSLLRAHLYPLKLDKVSEPDVGKWLTECVNAGLVRLYTVKGRPFVEVLKFGARVRAEKSKWASPDEADQHSQTSADICQQPQTNAPVFVFEVVSEDVVGRAPPPSLFDEFWKAYPVKVGKDAARKAFEKRNPDGELLARMIVAIGVQKQGEKWLVDGGKYIPHPATWINGGRWMDEARQTLGSKTVPSTEAEATRLRIEAEDRHRAEVNASRATRAPLKAVRKDEAA